MESQVELMEAGVAKIPSKQQVLDWVVIAWRELQEKTDLFQGVWHFKQP